MNQKFNVLVLNENDTVGVAINDLKAGEVGFYQLADKVYEIKIVQDIPIFHKVALKDMLEGENAYKYGQNIGRVISNIISGQHIHTHNLMSIREGVNEWEG